MATLKIYRDNTELAEVNIGDDTIRESYFMGDDRVRVSFSYPEIIDFLPYDYIIHNGKRYSIKGNEMPTRKEYGKRRFDYDIVFKSPEYRMHDMPLSHLGESKFDYFGTPSQILQLVIDCMSVIDNGFVLEIDEPADIEPLHIYFDNVTCRQAVTQACELFGLEYNFDGHVLYVGKSVGNRLEGFTFSQGKGNGLYTLTEVSMPDSSFATRFYGFGGSENLPLDYKSGRKNLVMTGEFIERNIDLYGLIVQNVYFDDIFPTRTGALTAVSSDFLTLTDTSIDFDLNDQQIEGAKIVFTSGELGGQEFEITSYDHATKAMRINRLEESEGYFLPNAIFSPKVGDKYKFVGIIMPESYIIAAENKVAQKTLEYAEKHSHPSVGFELELDELELRRRGLVGGLNVGTWIHVVSTKLSVDRYLRITELSYPLANPSKITAKISDVVSYTLTERILKDVSGNKKEIATIEREQKKDFSILSRKSAEQARLQAERLNELREYIFDADNYFDSTKIKPLSIETGMLSVGAKSQNFYLSGVTMQPNYLGDPNRFYVSAGQLQHREISIDAGYIWNLTAQAFYGLEPNKTYYLSAKCSKTTLTGTYTLTDTPKNVESEAGFYHFNIGVLYPIGTDGSRFFANTSGVSYVVGSQITTGRVKSLDGNTWFDLDTGEIRGAIKFTSGQTVESAIEQAKGEAVAQSGVATQQAIAALSIGGRNYAALSKIKRYEGGDLNSPPIFYTVDGSKVTATNQPLLSAVIGFKVPVKANESVCISLKSDTLVAVESYRKYFDENGVGLSGQIISPLTKNGNLFELKIVGTNVPAGSAYFHIGLGSVTISNYSVYDISIVYGDKFLDYQPAPEDLEQLIIDTDNARKAYVDAQDNLKETETKAYADGIVSAEEQRAIADATAKANAAKSYADAQDILLKAQADAYTDGKLSAEESARIAQATSNLSAAKSYADAQDNLSKIETKAYADGIVDAEEARAIADAQAKLNEAKSHAEAQASQAQVNAIAASNTAINTAINALSIGGRNLFTYSKIELHQCTISDSIDIPQRKSGKSKIISTNGDRNYARFHVLSEIGTYTFSGWIKRVGSVSDFPISFFDGDKEKTTFTINGDWQYFKHTFDVTFITDVYDFIQFRSNSQWVSYALFECKLEKGSKATDWTPAPEDLQQQIVDTDNARKTYVDAQDDLKETQTKAYADGKVSAEEARAIADATEKANAAKAYADAQDLLLKAQTDAYADGKVSAEESARIAQATNNLNAAKAYAEAQDNLSKIETKAYADGIVDAEEARAIADAQAKLNEAKNHADAQANIAQVNAIAASSLNISAAISALSFGGRNLIKDSGEERTLTTGYEFSVKLKHGNEYTWGLDIKSSQVGSVRVYFLDNVTGSFADKTITLTSEFVRHSNTGVTPSWWNNDGSVFFIYNPNGLEITFKEVQVEEGNKASAWKPAPEDLQQQIIDTDNARKAYVDAQDSLKEIQIKAYADGIVSAEEARAIADATAKVNEAKTYADTLKAQTDNYINSVVSPIQSVFHNWKSPTSTKINGNEIEAESIRAASIIIEELFAKHIATNNVGARTTINLLPEDQTDPTHNTTIYRSNAIRQYHESGKISMYEGIVKNLVITVNGVTRTINGQAKVVYKDELGSPILYVVDSYTQNGMQYVSTGTSATWYPISVNRLSSVFQNIAWNASPSTFESYLETTALPANNLKTILNGRIDYGLMTGSVWINSTSNYQVRYPGSGESNQNSRFVTSQNGNTPIADGWYHVINDNILSVGNVETDPNVGSNYWPAYALIEITMSFHYIESGYIKNTITTQQTYNIATTSPGAGGSSIILNTTEVNPVSRAIVEI